MSRSRAGFTVVELMIALTCGGIAISSMYIIGTASMRTFRAQERIATTQSSLRSALAQVKRDFQRAGFMGTPNVDLPAERCTPPVSSPVNDTSNSLGRGRLAAISAYQQNLTPSVGGFSELDPDGLNVWNRLDDVILTGNYSTSAEYMGVLVAPSGMSLSIPYSTHGFTRDFTHWYAAGGQAAGTCNEGVLKLAFAKGRLLRLHTLAEPNAFLPIASATCNNTDSLAQIDLDATIPGTCNGTGGWISPVNVIRYWVKNAQDVLEKTVVSAKNRVVQLRRTEVYPDDKTKALEISEGGATRLADDRAVLDYVVHFRVDFLMRDTNINSIDFVPATQLMVANNPERVRGAIIELGARTSEHEPEMDGALFDVRFPPFKVYNTRGSARTRVMKAELLLPNLAQEGY
jgi:type II secretory pathway pseudopilin PulG